MAAKVRILALAGSTRSGSFNKLLVREAAEGARAAGAEVTIVDLRHLAMPLYDGDLEATEGLPAAARELKDLMRSSDGFLISSPEYNSSISGVLKNAIDWASRPGSKDEPPLVAFDGKVAGLVSASPGALGGLRGLVHLRSILGNMKVLVIPDQVAVAKAHEAFTPEGKLKDAKQSAQVQAVGRRVAEIAARLKAG